jgi:hypothetical protein
MNQSDVSFGMNQETIWNNLFGWTKKIKIKWPTATRTETTAKNKPPKIKVTRAWAMVDNKKNIYI